MFTELRNFLGLKASNFLGYDYGTPRLLLKARFLKLMFRLESGNLGKFEYLLNGYKYLGNIGETGEFNTIRELFEDQTRGLRAVSPYSEEISELLCKRDSLPLDTRKRQISPECNFRNRGQPSMLEDVAVSDLFPKVLSDWCRDCLGFPIKPSSLVAWKQVEVPFIP